MKAKGDLSAEENSKIKNNSQEKINFRIYAKKRR